MQLWLSTSTPRPSRHATGQRKALIISKTKVSTRSHDPSEVWQVTNGSGEAEAEGICEPRAADRDPGNAVISGVSCGDLALWRWRWGSGWMERLKKVNY